MRNQYGTASLVALSLEPRNIKLDTQGRVIVFVIGDVTFANVYLPSGIDTVMRNLRGDYILGCPEKQKFDNLYGELAMAAHIPQESQKKFRVFPPSGCHQF